MAGLKSVMLCGFLVIAYMSMAKPFLLDDLATEQIKVGSFNVKWFTVKRAANKEVLKTLGRIINRYDVMLMMEIRDDDKQTAMTQLWKEVNQTKPYGLILSKPLGRYPNFYTEQYAFFYRVDRIDLVDFYQYDDSVDNEFEREPYAVLIKSVTSLASTDQGMALIGSHIQPKNAVNEMNDLLPVVNAVLENFKTDTLMIMGDLNADCSYMSTKEISDTALMTDKRFVWLIPDNADTTVSTRSDCAYDRIIASQGVKHSTASVFYFDKEYGLTWDEAWEVSDHYPVEVDVSIPI